MPRTWEPVIGLEVHCELATASKMFCARATDFGDEPNTLIARQPRHAGISPGDQSPGGRVFAAEPEALHLQVPERSIFARKNYFYPDLPKGYQISQYDEPITIDDFLDGEGERVGITRWHMEEDTGKSLHVGGGGRIHDADHSLVDYNRAGVPLLEIVSEPDIRSAEQAKRYVEELRAPLLVVGVSDVKMEEGSLRIDANVSVRPAGSTEFGTRAEIKNLNSLRSLLRAVEHETVRQIGAHRVGRAGRAGDAPLGRRQRPHDLGPFEGRGARLPLFPRARSRAGRAHGRDARACARVDARAPGRAAARRLIEAWGIKEDDARVIVDVPGLADYAERAVAALKSGTAQGRCQLGPPRRARATSTIAASRRRCSRPRCWPSSSVLVTDGTISRGQARRAGRVDGRGQMAPDIVEARASRR